MGIDWSTVLLACIGSSGFFALLQLFINRVFKKNDDKDEIHKNIKQLQSASKESALDSSRCLLLILIAHYPDDHQAVIKEAERYFVDLHGDSWMWGVLSEWAEKENVNIEYLHLIHERNKAENS